MQLSTDRVKGEATVGEGRRGCNNWSGAAEPFVCYNRLKPPTLWSHLVPLGIKGRETVFLQNAHLFRLMFTVDESQLGFAVFCATSYWGIVF